MTTPHTQPPRGSGSASHKNPAGSRRMRGAAPRATKARPGGDLDPILADAGDASCELCAEQMILMGLPYRIVLRCSHSLAD